MSNGCGPQWFERFSVTRWLRKNLFDCFFLRPTAINTTKASKARNRPGALNVTGILSSHAPRHRAPTWALLSDSSPIKWTPFVLYRFSCFLRRAHCAGTAIYLPGKT